MKNLIVPILIAALAAIGTFPSPAADAPPAQKTEAPARAMPFRGKLDAVDKQAKTFKINDRTFQITADTKISKDGKPATFDEATVGQDVTGSFREGGDKKLNVATLRIIVTKPPTAKPASPPAK